MPRAIGLPDAVVTLELSPRLGTFLIEPPPIDSVFTRLKWSVRAVFQTRLLVDELANQNERLALSNRAARVRSRSATIGVFFQISI